MFLPEEHSLSLMAPAKAANANPAADPAAAPVLSALERRVVEIARTDALDTLKPRRRHGWFVRLFMGRERASPALANETLEAIRRLAVTAWHREANPPVRAIGEARAISEARAAGLSRDQIDEILAIIRRSLGARIEKIAP